MGDRPVQTSRMKLEICCEMSYKMAEPFRFFQFLFFELVMLRAELHTLIAYIRENPRMADIEINARIKIATNRAMQASALVIAQIGRNTNGPERALKRIKEDAAILRSELDVIRDLMFDKGWFKQEEYQARYKDKIDEIVGMMESALGIRILDDGSYERRIGDAKKPLN
jgi:hypothetical protein